LRAVEALLEFNRQRAPECEVTVTVSDDFPSEYRKR